MVIGIAFYDDLAAIEAMMAADDGLVVDEEELEQAIEEVRQSGLTPENLSQAELRDLTQGIARALTIEDGALTEPMIRDSLVFFLENRGDVDPTYVEWLTAHGYKLPARQKVPTFFSIHEDGRHDPLSTREVTALTLAIEVLNGFFDTHSSVLRGIEPPTDLVYHLDRSGEPAVEARFPPAGFEWDDDDGGDDVPEEGTILSL